jgi:hypothetical protein
MDNPVVPEMGDNLLELLKSIWRRVTMKAPQPLLYVPGLTGEMPGARPLIGSPVPELTETPIPQQPQPDMQMLMKLLQLGGGQYQNMVK